MSTLFTTDADSLLTEQVSHDLLIAPLIESAVATNPALTRTVVTGSAALKFPRVTREAQAAWVAEGAEIPSTDIATGSVTISPAKIAAISEVTREAAEDTDPSAQQLLGNSLVLSLRRKLDQSFVQSVNTPTLAQPEPTGLAGLAGATEAVLDLTDLDSLVAAQYTIAALGGTCSGYLVSTEDAAELALLKTGDGSNQYLMQQSAPGQTTLNGVPLVVSEFLPTGTAYALDASSVIVAMRSQAAVETSNTPRWSNDIISIKAVLRASWGFADPAKVVRLTAG